MIFVGNIDSRNGLELFCDAIARLSTEASEQVSVTLAGHCGRMALHHPVTEISRRVRSWKAPWRFVSTPDPLQILQLLRSVPGRVVLLQRMVSSRHLLSAAGPWDRGLGRRSS